LKEHNAVKETLDWTSVRVWYDILTLTVQQTTLLHSKYAIISSVGLNLCITLLKNGKWLEWDSLIKWILNDYIIITLAYVHSASKI